MIVAIGNKASVIEYGFVTCKCARNVLEEPAADPRPQGAPIGKQPQTVHFWVAIYPCSIFCIRHSHHSAEAEPSATDAKISTVPLPAKEPIDLCYSIDPKFTLKLHQPLILTG